MELKTNSISRTWSLNFNSRSPFSPQSIFKRAPKLVLSMRFCRGPGLGCLPTATSGRFRFLFAAVLWFCVLSETFNLSRASSVVVLGLVSGSVDIGVRLPDNLVHNSKTTDSHGMGFCLDFVSCTRI
ncbi:hypothetical protein CROQUDRAFT_263524 [Cronartium quercuum f. sp. fusiforme G11]|uniref:Uncharacterized protein n=1 Tax=Cronartium quercuum f. sp. fusiforme G11 TaxID=708437 RepID=A0A9P6NPU7_9BASI|nr:hypothetical protein CROQUDRAFT_263524 [Cronartium quercuum f. sp. fusiforme G11]